ncbi:MAG: nucleotidyltransferase substrate binding protein [Burkholderiales bacterium]|nr:nucleotidyltransferase substrate binding protein [Burkholderiales bacterium]
MKQDIRWQQRFYNYNRALVELGEAVELSQTRKLTKLESQGLIQAFEYTHELAWKTLKDFIEERGNSQIFGSKDATREAFTLGLIGQGEVWMSMVNSRNQTSHTYDESTAQQIVMLILNDYYPQFKLLQEKLQSFI